MTIHIQDPPTILVIDNDPLTLTAIAAALHLSGYQCHCARDAEAAWKAARGLTLDLIICDMGVEEDHGLELVQQMREQLQLVDVPVIFISSQRRPDSVRQAHEAGGTYYLHKPFDPEVLLDLADRALWMPHLVSTRMRTTPPAEAR